MMYTVRYNKECAEEVWADSLAAAENIARGLALTHKWTLLSVSPSDEPKPMPGAGNWGKIPEWILKS